MRAAAENESGGSGDGDGKRIISSLAKGQNYPGRQWEAALGHLQNPGGMGWVAQDVLCPPTAAWLGDRGDEGVISAGGGARGEDREQEVGGVGCGAARPGMSGGEGSGEQSRLVSQRGLKRSA